MRERADACASCASGEQKHLDLFIDEIDSIEADSAPR